MIPAATYQTVTWTATDASGISHVELYLSDDGGSTFKQMAKGLPNTGSFDMFFPNLPGGNSVLRVEAYDNAGNDGHDDSPAAFTITPVTYGVVPTTLRDFELGGTQPFEGSALADPSTDLHHLPRRLRHRHRTLAQLAGQHDGARPCAIPCSWPRWWWPRKCVPAVGDLCLRCHTPGRLAGRPVLRHLRRHADRQGLPGHPVRLLPPHGRSGLRAWRQPAGDADILADLDNPALEAANGQFVTDPDPIMRGPYADAQASHQFLDSHFHRTSQLCGTCHDVSNPAFVAGDAPGKYDVQALDTPHPDGDRRNMFPVERTFSEWEASEYATTGVYQPQFAGDKPDGIVSTCQDCHMRDVTGVGCSEGGAPTRTRPGPARPDRRQHLRAGHPAGLLSREVDTAALQDGKPRAMAMLTLAATMELTAGVVDGQPGRRRCASPTRPGTSCPPVIPRAAACG